MDRERGKGGAWKYGGGGEEKIEKFLFDFIEHL